MNANTLMGLAALALTAAGCAAEVGKTVPQLGQAQIVNARLQKAYGDLADRLRDLSVAFRAAAPDTVTFDFNSARLGSEARRALDAQAMWLLANEGVRMSVIGHTDLVGSERYNDRLGLRRARAVVRYLVAKGVDRDRLDAVVSAGESEPVVQTEARERRNRRTVTVVAGLDRLYVGPNLDGQYAARSYDAFQATAGSGATVSGLKTQ